MVDNVEARVHDIKKLLFLGRYPEVIGSTQALLVELAADNCLDQEMFKKWLGLIFIAMNKRDYLLAADILSYEILPLYSKGREMNDLNRSGE